MSVNNKNKSLKYYRNLLSHPGDTVFKICMDEINEFPRAITNLDDIACKMPTNYVNEALRQVNLDSVRYRTSGQLLNIEHQTSMSRDILSRNFEYCTILHRRCRLPIDPWFFYTGDRKIPEIDFLNEYTPLRPNIVKTKSISGTEILNNLRYKKEHAIEVDGIEVSKLIWLHKYKFNRPENDVLKESLSLLPQLKINNDLARTASKCLYIWGVTELGYEEFEKTRLAEGLYMINGELPPFDELIRTLLKASIIVTKYDEGVKKGREEMVPALLKYEEPSAVAEKTGIDLSRILEIQKNGL